MKKTEILHAPSLTYAAGRWLCLAACSILLCAMPIRAEYAYCYIGTTGLAKGDFSLHYENTDTQASVATTAITVTEDPAASKWYYFSGLNAATANYRFAASYGGNIVCDYSYPVGGYAAAQVWQNSFSYSVNYNTYKQGDISPALQLTVPGFATDCTAVGWSAKFNMWNSRSNAVKIDDAAASVSCTLSGTTYTLVFSYTMTATNTNMGDCLSNESTCSYLGEFGLYNPLGVQVQTFPPDNQMRVQVVRKR